MKNDIESRKKKYYKISKELANIDKKQLDLLFDDKNKTQGWGINHIIKIAKSKVFVKRIPLTELEHENLFSTKNLYDLPTYYNYGVGSAGFGAFRELETHIKTTKWVLDEEIENFPLMYDYKIVPCLDKKDEIDMEKHQKYIERWNNNENISKYIIERKNAKYEIVIFLEYFPYMLSKWLEKNRNEIQSLVNQMQDTINFLIKKDIIHFDIHFRNIITDGKKMYLTDFGLVLDKNFDLDEKEKLLFKENLYYDCGEFLYSVAWNLYSLYNKKSVQKKLIKYGIIDERKLEGNFIVFIKNLEKISNEGIIKLNRSYIDIITKYYEIIVLMSNFYGEITKNNKKDTKYSHTKLANLVKKTDFIK